MKRFINRWEIQSNWQLLFPVLGIIGLLFSGYVLGKFIMNTLGITETSVAYLGLLSSITLLASFIFLFITLKLFSFLETRWDVTYRWELIAIFIAFAITGSTAARISDPIISLLGLTKETTIGWIYWPVRIVFIFPVYQILLLIIGWLFGQFKFFWNFEKKMLSRLGFARFLGD
ncbi:prolipoprotein diacylglyceryl transferase [Aquimarina sp. U1-2]|uniref:DUF6787 family protein n=1 Tax=Aquimarina sp. U1-2 TaxID=2823141 RepID=UPI001AECCFE9|nr:DUF6787 family protein [Aquimarina sp. U1-2]MBP2832706.1 prolipoprotein diacylglyceryl transferase [Aquimarina sp. U1-2]